MNPRQTNQCLECKDDGVFVYDPEADKQWIIRCYSECPGQKTEQHYLLSDAINEWNVMNDD